MPGQGKRTLALLCLLLILPWGAAGKQPEGPPRRGMRALLVGCDHFITQPDTWPSADHNLQLLGDTLLRDSRRYALIRSYSDSISSVEAFQRAVENTFQGAGEEDISLLYISTHGLLEEEGPSAVAALLLSDGYTEEKLEAAALQQILDRVPGRKVVILDACNSGAFIGKGLSGGAERAFFCGEQYKVLCSAGGSEASWYWQGADASTGGASYFATVLADGLGDAGGHAADANVDGQVTLREIYDYLWDNYAVSTPQVYPQHDEDFVIYAYDAARTRPVRKAVTDITFEDTLLPAGRSQVKFSFTVQRQTELYYQVVYHQDGAWQFAQAQHFLDGEQADGTVLPGRKMRTLALDTTGEDAFGYAIIQLITMEDERPVLQGARLLCVQPEEGEVQLRVMTDAAFLPAAGQELCILAQHDVPCGLTVAIVNEEGRVVRRLAYDQPSRPQQLIPAASSFYWDGKTAAGDMAPPGRYTVRVRVRLGENTFLCESPPFELLESSAGPPRE